MVRYEKTYAAVILWVSMLSACSGLEKAQKPKTPGDVLIAEQMARQEGRISDLKLLIAEGCPWESAPMRMFGGKIISIHIDKEDIKGEIAIVQATLSLEGGRKESIVRRLVLENGSWKVHCMLIGS
jgi:hypothetical protein